MDCTARGDADFCTVLYATYLPSPSLLSTLNPPSHPVLRRVGRGMKEADGGGGGGGGERGREERGKE